MRDVMEDRQTHTDSLAALLTLMELGEESRVWQVQELAAILKHQLRAPLWLALGDFSGEVVQKIDGLAAAAPGTLDELFHQSQPSCELLELTKLFAKSCNVANGPLPREIAVLLYYLSIATAEVRCEKRLSQLSDEALIRGLAWCGAQTWLDQSIRLVILEALGRVGKKRTAEADGVMPPLPD
jgi:hypothetical protein